MKSCMKAREMGKGLPLYTVVLDLIASTTYGPLSLASCDPE